MSGELPFGGGFHVLIAGTAANSAPTLAAWIKLTSKLVYTTTSGQTTMPDAVNAPVRIGTYTTKAKRKRAENRAAAPPPEGAQKEKQHIAALLKANENVKANLGQAEYDTAAVRSSQGCVK